MEQLHQSQLHLHEQIGKLLTNYKKTSRDRLTTGFIEARLEIADKYWESFQSQHNSLMSAKSEVKATLSYFKDDVYDSCLDNYLDLKTRMKERLNEIQDGKLPAPANIVHANNPVVEQTPKLPPIQLPTFSGDYRDWLSFRDLYKSLVHDNISISKVNKCQYLKSSLRGEAEHLVKQIQVSDANYEIIWDMINKRYDNKRSIVNTYIGKLLNQKKIISESAKTIRELLDVTTECLATLKSLNLPTDSWDDIVVYVIIQKLDSESHKMFEQRIESNNHLPTWKELSQFLEFRFRTLEITKSKDTQHPKALPPTRSFATEITQKLSCVYCKENHHIFSCKEFCKLDLTDKKAFVQSNQLCFNCLRKGHNVSSCLQSTSCRKCGRKHHTLLHGYVTPASATTEQSETEPRVATHSTTTESKQRCQVILATAMVHVQSQREQSHTHTLRALVDQGSQASLITEAACQFLGYKRSPVQGTVMGVGSAASVTKACVEFDISSTNNPEIVSRVTAYVLKSLTSYIPQTSHTVDWPQLRDLELADPTFQRPGKIDIILGADVYAEIIQEGVKILKNYNNTLVAQQTSLGWLIAGKTTTNNHISQVHVHHLKVEVENILRSFWEIEENTEKRVMTREETQCEKHYETTHTRLEDGQYRVKLPFATYPPDLGESFTLAKKRLLNLESKFKRDKELKNKYNEFMEDYLKQGHMEVVPSPDTNDNVCYIPHQAVINEQHLTTKLRVVFDSSAKTTNGKSLNDNLLVGPALQNDIRDVTLRWRRHRLVLVGDIRQMYRKISLDESDRDWLRILWRFDTEQDIQHFRLTTVTYGTSCAPYQAIKTLRQLAKDEKGNCDEQVIDALLQDFYIDDLLTGEQTTEKINELKNKMTELLSKGGFSLHKWASNSTDIEGAEQSNRKILGINWNGHTDKFELKVMLPPSKTNVTKREVLCDIAKIYDPAGWMAPVVITAKNMLQKLWIDKVDWDDPLPETLLQEWLTYRNELTKMPTIEMKRWIGVTDNMLQVELHGFSDASTIAYSAVVYCRVITPERVTVTLIEAKTRVAPVKEISLPRLELCGAVILAKLLHRVQQALCIPIQDTYAWTDATIVLAWLQRSPSYWYTFVANRVTEITNLIVKERWHHVTSQENPADVASRGVPPADLPDHQLWWHGPTWLHSSTPLSINEAIPVEPTDLEKKVSVKVNVVHVNDNQSNSETSDQCNKNEILHRFSNLFKLIRVVAIIYRFYNCLKYKCKNKSFLKCTKYLSTIDLKNSLQTLVKMSQTNNLKKEIDVVKGDIRNDKYKLLNKLKNGSKISKLNPFVDSKDVLRVGGRICKADIQYDMKHPIILSKDCNLSYLIVKDAHHKTLHGGVQLMLNVITYKYHIIGVKQLVKQTIRECVSCCRHSGKTNSQIMGNLPEFRITPQRPFSICGVDLAGPVILKLQSGRGSNRTQKAWIVLFICTAVKAVHLELLTSLSSEAFMSAFKRFTSRRGHCKKLVSDCGTNFIGASKELEQSFVNSLKNLPDEISELLAQNGTEWQFNPAGAPHMGGLWESNIKSVKRHLSRVLNDAKLTFEEYYTLLCQIECCLNSRPLTPLNNDETASALTPGHFLIGEAPVIVPQENLIDQKIPYVQRWLYIQQKLQYFWRKWSHEYLINLQNRQKWTSVQRDISVGDIVLIKDERLPPAKWLLGLVLNAHPGSDGRTRVVTLKCKNTTIKRPIHKLCLLPTNK